MHFRESNFQKFSGGACPRTPLEARAFGPLVYRAARLLYHENPPTSKINENPATGKRNLSRNVENTEILERRINYFLYLLLNAMLTYFSPGASIQQSRCKMID